MFAKSFVAMATFTAFLGPVTADFRVYTEPPIPTTQIPTFTGAAQSNGWLFSVSREAQDRYDSFTDDLGPTFQSSYSSAMSAISAWVASAPSNYSIPSDVTQDSRTLTLYSEPDWYTALPSEAREVKEQQVSDEFSFIREVIEATATSDTNSPNGGVLPTGRPELGGAKLGVMAAAAWAVFL